MESVNEIIVLLESSFSILPNCHEIVFSSIYYCNSIVEVFAYVPSRDLYKMIDVPITGMHL